MVCCVHGVEENEKFKVGNSPMHHSEIIHRLNDKRRQLYFLFYFIFYFFIFFIFFFFHEKWMGWEMQFLDN